jgi:hypothetical protein
MNAKAFIRKILIQEHDMKKIVAILLCSILAACGGGGSNSPSTTASSMVQGAPTIQGFSADQMQTITTSAPIRMASMMKSSADVRSTEATIHGYRENYTISVLNGAVSVQNKTTNETTNFGSITTLKFADDWVSFDATGPESQVYRLYQAAFNRQPDIGGLGFWIMAYKNGSTLQDISGGFMQSDEFKKMYGAQPTNELIISKFYNNVLHRDAEKSGFDWWVGVLNTGNDRKGALTGFSESYENKNNLKATLLAGFVYTPHDSMRPNVPVQKSSYLNSKNLASGIAHQALPIIGGTMHEEIQNGYAYGDFFQNKTMSLVTFTEIVPGDGTTSNTKGGVHFFKKDTTGAWIDATSELLKDTTGCITPRKLVVADFNNDGIPDVFASCHGYDGNPLPGEAPRILLSQPDGTYTNTALNINCFCHGAAAADITGDGNIDIVIADLKGSHGKTPVYALINDGKGNFTPNYDIIDRPELEYKTAFWAVELIMNSKTGKYDILLGGTESDVVSTQLIHQDPNGKYIDTPSVKLPTVKDFETVLDFVVNGSDVYVLRVMSTPFYGGVAIQKVDTLTNASTLVYSHTGTFGKYLQYPVSWFSWMEIDGTNLVSENPFFNVSIPLATK